MKQLPMVTAVAGSSTLALSLGLALVRKRRRSRAPFGPRAARGSPPRPTPRPRAPAAEILRQGRQRRRRCGRCGAGARGRQRRLERPRRRRLRASSGAPRTRRRACSIFARPRRPRPREDMFVVDGKVDPQAVALGRAGGGGAGRAGRPGRAREARTASSAWPPSAQPAIKLARAGYAVSHHQFCSIDVRRAGCVAPVQFVRRRRSSSTIRCARSCSAAIGRARRARRSSSGPSWRARSRRSARRGPAAFYQGRGRASRSPATVQARGGILTASRSRRLQADLARSARRHTFAAASSGPRRRRPAG